METGALVLAIALMAVGVSLVMLSVFREIGRAATGPYGLVALAIGFGLILLGLWLVQ